VLGEFGNHAKTARKRFEVNDMDERYDLEKSTQAACSYFLVPKQNLAVDLAAVRTMEEWLG
jgi:hypothetical protein